MDHSLAGLTRTEAMERYRSRLTDWGEPVGHGPGDGFGVALHRLVEGTAFGEMPSWSRGRATRTYQPSRNRSENTEMQTRRWERRGPS